MPRRRPMSMELEALEPRLLLSADAMSAGAAPPLEGGGADSQLVLAQNVPDAPIPADEVVYVPANEVFDLFGHDPDAPHLAPAPVQLASAGPPPAPSPTPTPMEYATPVGKALNATLKLDGSLLTLVDNSSQKTLQSQNLFTISEVVITGSEQDDLLKVDATDADAWLLKVKFHATGQATAGGDRLEILGATDIDATYFPAKKGGAGAVTLLKN